MLRNVPLEDSKDRQENVSLREYDMAPKICLVDDDTKLVDLLKRFFGKNGFDQVDSLEPADIVSARTLDYDLFILDIMMPGIDGFEVCRAIRRKSEAFVVFLSAKDEAIDRILGIELGADDYLTKPFEPRELLARVQALFRRRDTDSRKGMQEAQGKMEFEDFSFDLDRQMIAVGGVETPLTTYEYTLLKYLALNNNIILTREQIVAHMEQNDFLGYGRSVDIGISRLRKKIEQDPKNPKVLKTIWGRGYQFASPRQKN